MAVVDRSSVIIGSGQLYLAEFEGSDFPDDTTFEADENSVGRIKGGAVLTYEPEEYPIVDDNGETVLIFMTAENATFKTGFLNWDMQNLAKLTPNKVIEPTGTDTDRKLIIGGAAALSKYALRFVHTKTNGMKLRITMVGTAGSGFELNFAGDTETVLDAEFRAINQDDGTLVEIRDQIRPVTP